MERFTDRVTHCFGNDYRHDPAQSWLVAQAGYVMARKTPST